MDFSISYSYIIGQNTLQLKAASDICKELIKILTELLIYTVFEWSEWSKRRALTIDSLTLSPFINLLSNLQEMIQ